MQSSVVTKPVPPNGSLVVTLEISFSDIQAPQKRYGCYNSIFSGITRGRVLNVELYAQILQKFINKIREVNKCR